MENNGRKQIDMFLFKKHLVLFFRKINIFHQLIENKQNLYNINLPLDLMLNFSSVLAQNFLKTPYFCFIVTEEYLKELYLKIQNKIKNEKKLKLKFTFNFKKKIIRQFTSPRLLKNSLIGEMIFIEGIVISCGEKKVKIKQSVHFCPKSEKLFIKKIDKNPNNFLYFSNVKDINGNDLEPEYGLSKFIDWQNIFIQDLPENVPIGLTPKKVAVILEEEFVNSCSIGQRIRICGIYQPLKILKKGVNVHLLFCCIKCLSFSTNLQFSITKFLKCDIILMKNFSLLIDSFCRLASLVAPKIFGQMLVKKGILLLLTGKSYQIKKKELNIKQTIHILLIGDLCSLKTHFLRFVENFSPDVVFTTLNSNDSIELGIKIAKNFNNETNNIIPGPLVLADNGIICIDELENISDFDKIMLSEVLENQMISFSDPTFPPLLKARCSVLASATSIFGKYNRNRSVQTNINLPSKIISGFDLVFLIHDDTTSQEYNKFANYLINEKRSNQKKNFNTNILKKNENFVPNICFQAEELSIDFLRLFISYSKTIQIPSLAEETIKYILNDYIRLKFLAKKNNHTKIKYIESIIRLTLNYTKLHFRSISTLKDVLFINNYLTIISKNNQDDFINKKQKNNKCLPTHIPILSNYWKINNKITGKPIKFNMMSMVEIYFVTQKFSLIKSYRISFLIAKKFLTNKDKNSFFERTISEWLVNQMCLLFKKNLVIL